MQDELGKAAEARSAEQVVRAIQMLRTGLALSQRHREEGEEIRRKLYGRGAGS